MENLHNKYIKRIMSYTKNMIRMPTQFQIQKNKNFCCGIGYNVIKFKKYLITKYLLEEYENYTKCFEHIMKISCDRKSSNPYINDEGEFIDEKTIQEDFADIYNNMEYSEFLIGEFCEDNEKNIKKIYEIITNLSVTQPVIICRNVEIFTIIRITHEYFLLVDSHIPLHGLISNQNILKHLFYGGNFNGIITLGYYKNKNFDCDKIQILDKILQIELEEINKKENNLDDNSNLDDNVDSSNLDSSNLDNKVDSSKVDSSKLDDNIKY